MSHLIQLLRRFAAYRHVIGYLIVAITPVALVASMTRLADTEDLRSGLYGLAEVLAVIEFILLTLIFLFFGSPKIETRR